MKKILALIFTYLFIFVQISHAGWWMVSGQVVGAGGAPAEWDMEVYFEGTAVTTTYTAGGNDAGFTAGTLSEAGLIDEVNNYITLDATGEHLNIPITGGDIFTSSEGALEIRFRLATTIGTNYLIEFEQSIAVNSIYVRLRPDNQRSGKHEGNNVKIDFESIGNAISDNTWSRVRMIWKVTGNTATDYLKSQIDIDDDGIYDAWSEVSNGTAMQAFSVEPSNVSIGSASTHVITDTLDIDYVKVTTDSTIFD